MGKWIVTRQRQQVDNRASILESLTRGRWFSGLDPPLQHLIVQRAHVVRFARGDLLSEEGKPPTGLYALLAGHVCVTRRLANGVEVPVHIAGKGFWTGEYATFSGQRVIGSIVYPAAELVEPGVVRVVEGNRFTLGELDGQRTPRIEALSKSMMAATFKAPVSRDIRAEIWVKLWGNLSFNPISALTHATLEDICRFPLSRDLAARMMTEAKAVGEKLGVEFKVSLDQRIAGAEGVGAHKTSMLQDVEHGRALELQALVGSVVELARITDTPTPTIDAIYAATALLTKTLADRHGRLEVLPA